jgi:tRNA nucleotidyltransferase (CCA-adding enzyme)
MYKYVINKLLKNGYEAYLVGGCVRDKFMGRVPQDYDIATNALPEAIEKLFKKTVPTGIKHGTVTVIVNKKSCEVTTYRIDGFYSDNRRPDAVAYTSELTRDLERRDFTMNAVAYRADCGYVDPFGGREDIRNKTIRCVGDPDARFAEDALRMVRAVRFSAQLGFRIDDRAYAAILKNCRLIKHVSAERFRDELIKILSSRAPEKIGCLADANLLSNYNLDIPVERIRSLKNSENNLLARLSLLFADSPRILKNLKMDNKTINIVSKVIEKLNAEIQKDGVFIKKLAGEIGFDAFRVLAAAKKDREALRIFESVSSDPIFIKDLKINGDDLKAAGLKDGKKIGEALKFLRDRVLQNPELNEKNFLLEIFYRNFL